MKRSVRPIPTRAGKALPLSGVTLQVTLGASLGLALMALAAWLLAGDVGAALASPAGALRVADGTPAPSPTVMIAVPTIGPGSATQVAPAAPAMTGITVAATLTCVTAVLGLVIAVVTLSILLRGGYGPFLRALVFGSKAASKAHGKRDAGTADKAADDRWDASHTLNYRPGPDPLDDPFDVQRDASFARSERHADWNGRRGSSRPGGSGRRAPSSSRRSDW